MTDENCVKIDFEKLISDISPNEEKEKYKGRKQLVCVFNNCKKVVKSEYLLKRHFARHLKNYMNEKVEGFKCLLCDKVYKFENKYKLHKTSCKGKEKFYCRFCQKEFSLDMSKTAHERSEHIGYLPFKCPLDDCYKWFSIKEYLTRHIREVHKISIRSFPSL